MVDVFGTIGQRHIEHGHAKRRTLLHAFGSLQGVKAASVEQIASLPGFGPESARRVLTALGVEPTASTPESP